MTAFFYTCYSTYSDVHNGDDTAKDLPNNFSTNIQPPVTFLQLTPPHHLPNNFSTNVQFLFLPTARSVCSSPGHAVYRSRSPSIFLSVRSFSYWPPAAATAVPVSGHSDTGFAGAADEAGQFELPAEVSARGSTLRPCVERQSQLRFLGCR